MATKIREATEIKKVNIIDSISRYQKSTVIYYGDAPKTTFEIYKRNKSSTSSDKVTLISAGWEYRPDLVSFDLFGVPDYWWIIMEENGMKDILEFKSGVTIRIPADLGV